MGVWLNDCAVRVCIGYGHLFRSPLAFNVTLLLMWPFSPYNYEGHMANECELLTTDQVKLLFANVLKFKVRWKYLSVLVSASGSHASLRCVTIYNLTRKFQSEIVSFFFVINTLKSIHAVLYYMHPSSCFELPVRIWYCCECKCIAYELTSTLLTFFKDSKWISGHAGISSRFWRARSARGIYCSSNVVPSFEVGHGIDPSP